MLFRKLSNISEVSEKAEESLGSPKFKRDLRYYDHQLHAIDEEELESNTISTSSMTSVNSKEFFKLTPKIRIDDIENTEKDFDKEMKRILSTKIVGSDSCSCACNLF